MHEVKTWCQLQTNLSWLQAWRTPALSSKWQSSAATVRSNQQPVNEMNSKQVFLKKIYTFMYSWQARSPPVVMSLHLEQIQTSA